jgi:hypothetical protein
MIYYTKTSLKMRRKMPSGGANKFSYSHVKSVLEEHGFKLLDKNYVNNNTPIRCVCVCGNEVSMRLSHIKKGERCQKHCMPKTLSDKFKTKDREIKKICEDNGCKLIESYIHNKKTRVKYICKCGREWEAYLCNFKRFPNCKKCGNLKVSGENCYMYDPDREGVRLRRKFSKMCGQYIRRFMEATGQKKTRHTHELLGYTPQQLQNHILNHPDYDKVKDGSWHVDHIMPIQAFLDHNILDLKIINALDNLRPMKGELNLSKADVYDKEEFINKYIK